MAGPLSRLMQQGAQGQGQGQAGPGQPMQVHGPAAVHDPSTELVTQIEAMMQDPKFTPSQRKRLESSRHAVTQTHEASALLQRLDTLRGSGGLSEEEVLKVEELKNRIKEQLTRQQTSSDIMGEYGGF